MNNKYLKLLLALGFILPLAGCKATYTETETITKQHYVANGGFESSDLSGWTVEYGDAFTDDSVSSRETFYFDDDANHNLLSINQTGHWYLSGKGFDLSYDTGRVGAIRSSNFSLTDDGYVSFKLAGGSITTSNVSMLPDEVEPTYKNVQERCFLAVYLAETDQMIAYQENEYFLEHNHNSYVDPNKYDLGVYCTDNFFEYSIDLSEYANQECYIRIVDNDRHIYYGYLSVDDIRIGLDADEQEVGAYYTKTREYITDVDAIDEYHIKNPDFEIGSLGGWTIVSGDAFSHEGVNNESTWWNEHITYNRDGNYHYGHYNPSGVGVLRSSVFKLGGKGYVSFKLGGCMNQELTYIRFMSVKNGEPVEVAKVSNVQYKNEQFPYIPMKMHLLNMIQYYVDLSEFIGENLYFEIVDNNASSDDLGCMTFDSFETYYTSTPYWEDKEYYYIDISSTYEREPDSEYQVKNGTFETGDLTGWTPSWSMDSQKIGRISSKSYWWDNPNLTFNKRGTYFFSGENDEGGTGTLTSSSFVVGGVSMMTFRMSGGRDPLACYISILDMETDEELLRFTNFMFNDMGTDLINNGAHMMDMILYKADLSSITGKEVKIQIVDNAVGDWGLVCVDSFITYYESLDAVDSSALLSPNTLEYMEEESSIYQVANGTFENGSTEGWTYSDADHPIMKVQSSYTWWNECFLFNKTGSFFLGAWSGWKRDDSVEANTGTLTSSAFTVGGSGYITYKLGGGKNKDLCHVEFIDADTEEVLLTTYNQKFKEYDNTKRYYYMGYPIDLASDGVYMGNMVEYKLDLSEFMGRQIKIRIVDNALNDWGVVFVDHFVTYYQNASDVPASAITANTL